MESIESLKSENTALKKEIDQLKMAGNLVATKETLASNYQESQVRFRTIFEASRLGNKIINSKLEILQVNPALVALLGYKQKEEVIGKKILDFTPEDRQPDWQFLQEKLWKQATPSFSLETCLRKKDGTIIWCQVTSILFPDKGETLGYTIIEDITEQHDLRLKKEEFISVASHELKTPITSLRATLQLINKMIAAEPAIGEKLARLVVSAEKNTLKLTQLVEDLLSSTKIEQGQLSLNKTDFPLSDLVENCCGHIHLDGRYHIRYEGDQSFVVYADQHKLEQVMINFVNNAIKYAPASEEIKVEIAKLDGSVKVSVTDRGRGIPPDDIPHIFERYYRAKNESNHVAGLGLGLYISSEIIRRHSGQIGVDSEAGKGSTFWFTLPC